MFRLKLESTYGAALTYVLLCVVCWASIPNFASRLRETTLDPPRYLFWSNAVSVLVLLVATCARGRAATFATYRRRDVLAIAGLGFLGAFAYYALLYGAYYQASPDNAPSLIIVQYTWPALTALLSGVVLREAFTRRAAAGVALGILAVACTFGGAAVPPVWQLLVVAVAAVLWAVFSVISKTRGFEPFTYVTLLFIAGTGWSAIWVASASSWHLPETLQDWTFVVLNGAVANGLSYVWYQRALRLAPAGFVVPWVSITPVLGALINAMLGKPLDAGHGLGVGLVLVSMWCTLGRQVAPENHPPPAPTADSDPSIRVPTTDALAVAAPVGRYRYH